MQHPAQNPPHADPDLQYSCRLAGIDAVIAYATVLIEILLFFPFQALH